MPYLSDPEDLALHGVRVLGFATPSRIADRYRLDLDAVQELLLDHEARGWISHLSFAGSSGWSLTDTGRSENERRLAAELDRAGAEPYRMSVSFGRITQNSFPSGSARTVQDSSPV